ncbi:hypothetical protein L798_05749 [Zootermopsis nevadensis]|uniref:Uncharacterized protein n=1 Tax=Zootermopsis nevadensis TaxID=136037 RepID=A0A067R842_ZOONE|nr:hypothetical protein L798_05749 [Zootermopsis nevadensis]
MKANISTSQTRPECYATYSAAKVDPNTARGYRYIFQQRVQINGTEK